MAVQIWSLLDSPDSVYRGSPDSGEGGHQTQKGLTRLSEGDHQTQWGLTKLSSGITRLSSGSPDSGKGDHQTL